MDLPETPGLGSSLPTLWFSLPSFETRLGPPAARWTPHQTATRNTKMSMCGTHIQRHKHTRVYRGWWAAGCLQRLATGHINRHQNTPSYILWTFPAHSPRVPRALLSCVFVSGLAFTHVDGSNLCRNQAVSLQWFHYPSRVPGKMVKQDS